MLHSNPLRTLPPICYNKTKAVILLKKIVKKVLGIAILIIVLFMAFITFCTNVLLGGLNDRRLGQYCPVFSDGEHDFIKIEHVAQDRYVEIGKGGWELAKNTDESKLTEKESAAEIVMACRRYRGIYRSDENVCKEGYEHLREQIKKEFADCKNFDCVIFKKDDAFYGSVNCYTRAAGMSGNLHTAECFDKSYIIEIENDKIKFKKELDDAIILASNQTHYISYTNKKFYSVNKQTDEKTLICKDEWYSLLPIYPDHVSIYYSDEYFTICANKGTQSYCTLFVGTMDGSYFEKITNQQIN